jgi:hypothetical protein
MMNRPFSTYNGGKNGSGTYQQIINFIPKIDLFIDAMVGNGGIVTNLLLPGLTVINDLDKSIIDAYDVTGLGGKIIKLNLDYSTVIDRYDGRILNTLFYFDPPYLKDTRKSKRNIYRYEWETLDHVKFLTRCSSVQSSVMISHYPCPLYDDYLKGWHTHDFNSMTRSGLRTERIYMNYPRPEVLQDFRYVGDNFRERQRIKRKIARFLIRLEAMPEPERIAILSSAIAKYNDASVQLSSIDKNILPYLNAVPGYAGIAGQMELI